MLCNSRRKHLSFSLLSLREHRCSTANSFAHLDLQNLTRLSQVAEADNQLAALFLFDCICKRASIARCHKLDRANEASSDAASLTQFLDAADGYAMNILRFVLPSKYRTLSNHERVRLLESVRSIIKNWERKALFRPHLILQARQLLSAAEEPLESQFTSTEEVHDCEKIDMLKDNPLNEPGTSFSFSPPR